jgi:hypothetical protein
MATCISYPNRFQLSIMILSKCAVWVPIFALLIALSSASAFDEPANQAKTKPESSKVRESRKLLINGVAEVWRLEWETDPTPSCSPKDPDWMTCPCEGFAFGEQGKLALVRLRGNREQERFPLDPLFKNGMNTPSDGEAAVLQRWKVFPKDTDIDDPAVLEKHLRSRPNADAMQLFDYNHDGQSSEFFLQTGVVTCGKSMGVVIGITPSKSKLHVFGTASHPETPLVLAEQEWKALLHSKGPVRITHQPCGDHGSEIEIELELNAAREGIQVIRRTFECADLKRGALISQESK